MKIRRRKRTFFKCLLLVYITVVGLFGYSLFETSDKSDIDALEDLAVKHIVQVPTFLRTTSYQTTTTPQLISSTTSRALVKLPDHEIFLYTAILSNSSSGTTWDRLAITGWEVDEKWNTRFICCVKFKSGLIRRTSNTTRVKNVQYLANLGPLQYVCNLWWRYNSSDPPTFATISLNQEEMARECPVEESRFIPIEYVYSHPTEIAALTKIIYGNVSLPDLVAWLEIHKSLGMDKVVFYSYRLGHNVSKVLQYYQKQKLVEIVPVSFPNPAYRTANFSSLILTYDYWVDEEIALVDGQERLRGYKYVVVFDIDEYIVPNGQRNWANITEGLSQYKPKAAGFKLFTHLFTTSWGVSSKTSLLQIGRYRRRTGRTRDRPKYIFIPSRVSEAGLHSHYFVPKHGILIPYVPEKLVALSHYRSCRDLYDGTSTKCFGFRRQWDESIYKRFEYMEDDVKRLLMEILG